MPSEKFRKLLRDTSKLKEAKKICENAGYKVSNSINESMHRGAIANNIKQCAKLLSSDDDIQYGRALCDILLYCTEGFAYFCNEYLDKNLAHTEDADEIASRVSDQIDDIKTAMNDLYDFVDEL